MKVIFLDIDGVLNKNSTSIPAPSGCMFVEETLIRRLGRICRATGAKVVLSSTWRFGWYDIQADKSDSVNAEDYIALSSSLLALGIPIHGHTPIIYDGSRGDEIRHYLRQSRDIDSYIILDDVTVVGFAEHQIKTSPKTGLTDADAERAIKMLS